MRHRTLLVLVPLLALIVVAGAVVRPGLAGELGRQADGGSGDLERFRATFLIPAGPPPGEDGRCPELTVEFAGEGLATHLGPFTTEQSHCVDPQGSNPFAFTDGTYTFTADGGTISGRYNGRLIPTETTERDGLALVDGRFTIEDGTGDFAGATGSGIADGLLNPETGEGAVTLDGTWGGPVPRGGDGGGAQAAETATADATVGATETSPADATEALTETAPAEVTEAPTATASTDETAPADETSPADGTPTR